MPQMLMSTSQAARALGVSNLSSEVNTLRTTRTTNVHGGTQTTSARPRWVRRDGVTPDDRLARIDRLLTRICRDFNLPTD